MAVEISTPLAQSRAAALYTACFWRASQYRCLSQRGGRSATSWSSFGASKISGALAETFCGDNGRANFESWESFQHLFITWYNMKNLRMSKLKAEISSKNSFQILSFHPRLRSNSKPHHRARIGGTPEARTFVAIGHGRAGSNIARRFVLQLFKQLPLALHPLLDFVHCNGQALVLVVTATPGLCGHVALTCCHKVTSGEVFVTGSRVWYRMIWSGLCVCVSVESFLGIWRKHIQERVFAKHIVCKIFNVIGRSLHAKGIESWVRIVHGLGVSFQKVSVCKGPPCKLLREARSKRAYRRKFLFSSLSMSTGGGRHTARKIKTYEQCPTIDK